MVKSQVPEALQREVEMNRVILIGRLGADPEQRSTAEGKSVCNFTLATSEGKDKTEWHRIVAWDKQAEFAGKYLTKGALVAIEGKLQTRSWEDKEGTKRYQTEVVAFSVQSLARGKEEAAEEAPPPKKVKGGSSLPF